MFSFISIISFITIISIISFPNVGSQYPQYCWLRIFPESPHRFWVCISTHNFGEHLGQRNCTY
jgi:hypothetical protein